MQKRTLILIIVLTALTALLVFLAIRNERQMVDQTTQDPSEVTVQELDKTAELSFSPNTVMLSSSSAVATVDIMIDTKEHSVDGVQLELVYDPTVLTNVRISPPSDTFFGGPGDSNNLFNDVDATRGRISYWLGINPTLTSKSGSGVVAQISFSLNPSSTASEAAIGVLERSMITESSTHTNVLATPSPLTITIER